MIFLSKLGDSYLPAVNFAGVYLQKTWLAKSIKMPPLLGGRLSENGPFRQPVTTSTGVRKMGASVMGTFLGGTGGLVRRDLWMLIRGVDRHHVGVDPWHIQIFSGLSTLVPQSIWEYSVEHVKTEWNNMNIPMFKKKYIYQLWLSSQLC